MNPVVGWGLAVAAIAIGYARWGWQGALMAISVVVFWLLLQWTRVMRAMRQAADAPMGYVPNAVMLHSKLKPGMRLLDVIGITRSLGERLDAAEDPQLERWRWTDPGGAQVAVSLRAGRVVDWSLTRPGDDAR